jgi:hypothetical protein
MPNIGKLKIEARNIEFAKTHAEELLARSVHMVDPTVSDWIRDYAERHIESLSLKLDQARYRLLLAIIKKMYELRAEIASWQKATAKNVPGVCYKRGTIEELQKQYDECENDLQSILKEHGGNNE